MTYGSCSKSIWFLQPIGRKCAGFVCYRSHGCQRASRSDRDANNYFWPHARAALRQIGLSDRHREERRVLRWVRAKKIETLSRETIRREIFSQRIDAERAQAIIDALVEAGWLREVTMKSHQHRPARRWQVNPMLGAGRSGRLRGPWRKQRERTETKVPAVPAVLA